MGLDTSVKQQEKLKMICEPLFLLQVKEFTYFKISLSGNLTYLNTDNKEICSNFFEQHIDNALRNLDNTSSYSEAFLLCHNMFNSPSCAIYQLSKFCLEGYLFNFNLDIEALANNFIILRPYLQRFVVYFKNEFSLPLKRGPYITPLTLNNNFQKLKFSNDKLKKFIDYTSINKLPILTKKGILAYLSPKQSILVLGMAKGLSYLEIEEMYGIRKKAADLYLTNIKYKTGYKNRYEIVKSFLYTNPWIEEDYG